jgi:acetate kinase
MIILVSNVGSTSFKCKLLRMEDERTLGSAKVDEIGGPQSELVYRSEEGKNC